MLIGSYLENSPNERRLVFSLDVIKKYVKNGIQVLLPKGYGTFSNINDHALVESGAILEDKDKIISKVDVLIKISLEQSDEIEKLKNSSNIIVSNFDKNNEDVKKKLKEKKINLFSLNYLPRITRAQSMDILSSQANLAGYKAVIDSTFEFNKAVPMMMTAAGTVSPAKFFIIGAGVAGLQAIATAKRLGGVVSATDVRLASKEQVESLGGRFIFVEDSENLETEGGYAKEASEDFKKNKKCY